MLAIPRIVALRLFPSCPLLPLPCSKQTILHRIRGSRRFRPKIPWSPSLERKSWRHLFHQSPMRSLKMVAPSVGITLIPQMRIHSERPH